MGEDKTAPEEEEEEEEEEGCTVMYADTVSVSRISTSVFSFLHKTVRRVCLGAEKKLSFGRRRVVLLRWYLIVLV